MSVFKVKRMGEAVEGVEILGDPRRPEPEAFRISFPFGDVEVVRATDGPNADYWVHLRVNRRGVGGWQPEDVEGKIVDGRLDLADHGSVEVAGGMFASPDLYHLAFRVGRR